MFHPGGQEANQVTVQALARLAERYQKAKGLQRWLSMWDAVKLTLVTSCARLLLSPPRATRRR